MTTVVIQIGNSDDKLSQREWSKFVEELREVIEDFADEVHFSGGSPTDAGWQNWCIVFELRTKAPIGVNIMRITDDAILLLRQEMSDLALRYQQDSIAMTVGKTTMVEP